MIDIFLVIFGRDPFGTRLQQGIKNRGFDQIQKFFQRNTHQSMKIFLGEKKFGG